MTDGGKGWAAGPNKKPGSMGAEADPRAYRAFETDNKALRLQLVPYTTSTHAITYANLLDVLYDHHFHASMTLIFSFAGVVVTGENLQPIYHAIINGVCGKVTQFHPNKFDKPAPGEPIVWKIEFPSYSMREAKTEIDAAIAKRGGAA